MNTLVSLPRFLSAWPGENSPRTGPSSKEVPSRGRAGSLKEIKATFFLFYCMDVLDYPP